MRCHCVRYPVMLILWALALGPAVALGQATTRTLSFPAGVSLGRLIAIDPATTSQSTAWQWGQDRIGMPLGDARGEVRIPAGARLALALDAKSAGVFDALARLPAGAFEMIAGYDLPLNDALLGALRQIKPPTAITLHQQDISDADAARLKGLGALRGLRVSNGNSITSATLAALGRLKGLEQLFLESESIDSRGLIHLAQLPALRSLYLRCVSPGPGLRDLAKFPALEHLTLRNLDGPGLRELALPPTCKSLSLTGTGKYEKGDFASIARMDGLETLSISYVLDDACVAHLKVLKTLKNLRVTFAAVVGPEDHYLSDAAAMQLARISTLEDLSLTYGNYTDRALAALAGLPRLRVLGMVNNDHFTEAGLAALKRAPALEELRLRGDGDGNINDFTDRTLLTLAEFPKLKKLTLMKRGEITDAGLAALKMRRPGLKVVIEREQAREEARKRAEKRKAEKMKTG